MMDPNIGWFQSEHKGPALDLWQRIWHQSNPNHTERQPDYIPFGEEGNDSTNNLNSKPNANQSIAGNSANNKGTNSSTNPNQSSVSSNSSQTHNKRFRRENPASTYNFDDNQHLVSKHKGTPWRQLRDRYEPGIIGLHQEIEDFYEYMKPRPEEHYMREDVVKRITKVVGDVWRDAKVCINWSIG